MYVLFEQDCTTIEKWTQKQEHSWLLATYRNNMPFWPWLSLKAGLLLLLLCRQLQAGYSSCTEQSKQFSFVATAKTVCTKWKQFDNKQIEETGRLKSVQSYHSYLVYLTQCCLQSGTAFNRVCIYIVCLFTLKYTCFSRGFIVNINYVYTALSTSM